MSYIIGAVCLSCVMFCGWLVIRVQRHELIRNEQLHSFVESAFMHIRSNSLAEKVQADVVKEQARVDTDHLQQTYEEHLARMRETNREPKRALTVDGAEVDLADFDRVM